MVLLRFKGIIKLIDFHTHIFQDKVQKEREKFFATEPEFKLLYNAIKAEIAGVYANSQFLITQV